MRPRTWVLAAIVLAGATSLGAQEPDPEPTAPPEATEQPEPPYAVSLGVGTFGFDVFQSQVVLTLRQSAGGVVLDSTLMRRDVVASGGLQVLGTGVIRIGDLWGARLGVGYGRTTLRTAYTGADTVWLITAEALTRRETTSADVVTAEAALRRWIPTARRVRPYVELGAAALRFESEDAVPGAEPLAGGVIRVAALAAAGGHIPLTDRFRARVQASVRAFRTPIDPAGEGTEGASSSTLRTVFRAPGSLPFADEAVELSTAVRLELGITFVW